MMESQRRGLHLLVNPDSPPDTELLGWSQGNADFQENWDMSNPQLEVSNVPQRV